MRISVSGFLIALGLLGAGRAGAAGNHPLVESILARYGLAAFSQVREVGFTFHAGKFGMGISHTWIYRPKADSVTRVDGGKSFSLKSPGRHEGLAKDFVNDWYWLSFPLHLAWDKGIAITVDSAPAPSPIRGESLTRVRVAYPRQGGFTPGDVYDLWAAPDGTIREWKYHRKGGKRGMKWKWDKHETYKGVTFATDHEGPFRIHFTGIHVN